MSAPVTANPPALIPLDRVKGLRVTCASCGASMVMPIAARQGPLQCFNCLRPLPGLDLVKLTRELHWLQDATAPGVSVEFTVALEVAAP